MFSQRGTDRTSAGAVRASRFCTARSRRRRSPRPIAAWFTSRPPGSKRPTGCRTADAALQQRRSDLPHSRRAAGRRKPSTPASPRGATTIMASRPTARCWRSATSRRERRQSLIYTLPITGGTPRQITPTGPSYWHGWSPDGKTLAFCGERDGEFDIYTIPAGGGPKTRLTTAPGLDDGPEYSPDGKFIYFNSVRTGTMQIWRMQADGSDAGAGDRRRIQQLVSSPLARRPVDGVSLLRKGRHGPPGKQGCDPAPDDAGKQARSTCWPGFFGGQGTINVPCWSPDGRRIAFVTYQQIHDRLIYWFTMSRIAARRVRRQERSVHEHVRGK